MSLYTPVKNIACALIIIIASALSVSCGGGGNGTTPPATTQAPTTAATATLAFDIKTFRFTWTDVNDATFYRLLENPDGVSGFTQVGGDIAQGTQSLALTVPLYQRINASYILQSCNSAGCTDDVTTTITGNLIAAIGYFKASNTGTNDEFGLDVALSADGSTLAVGAKNEASAANTIDGNENDDTAPSAGAVYIYALTNGSWVKQAYIKADNAALGDEFGTAVSLSDDGNLLAVGAPQQNTTGSVYTYTRNGSSWSQQDAFKAAPSGADLFGDTVSLSGDGSTLAVGARAEASEGTGVGADPALNGAPSAGAVYIYTVSANDWTLEEYIKAANANGGDFFGASVSLNQDGNTLVVGAPGESSSTAGVDTVPDNAADAAGAVYVFTRSGSAWSQQSYIKSSDTDAGDNFGVSTSVSDDGDTLAVGAVFESSSATGIGGDDTDNNSLAAGAAYVFTRNSNMWTQQSYIKASNTDAGDNFGRAVSLSSNGDSLVVGADKEQSNATGIDGDATDNSFNVSNGAGAAYVYTRSAGQWSQQAYVKASNTDDGDFYGTAVALSGDGNTLAVGADTESSNATGIGGDAANNDSAGSGAVYLY